MSEIARWSYQNRAAVRPLLAPAGWDVAPVYGEPYEIACSWTADSKAERDQNGVEFVSRHTVFTEDPRPQYGDLIQLAGHADWEEVRSRTEWEMAAFGDTPDFKLVT